MEEPGTLAAVGVGLIMLVGLAGTIIPILPGLLVIWAAALVYGLLGGFTVSFAPFVAISVLTLVGYVLVFALPGMRGAQAGAPTSTLLLGGIGAVLGFIAIPVVGLPLGGIGAIWFAERQRLGNPQQAWVSTKAVLVGLGLSVAVQVVFAVALIATWVVWLLL